MGFIYFYVIFIVLIIVFFISSSLIGSCRLQLYFPLLLSDCVPNCSKLHFTVLYSNFGQTVGVVVRLNKVVSFKLLVEKMKKTLRVVIYKYNRQTDLLYFYHYHLEP